MSTQYRAASGRYIETAGYAVSVLQAIANHELTTGESPEEYAARHLAEMATAGRVRLLEATKGDAA